MKNKIDFWFVLRLLVAIQFILFAMFKLLPMDTFITDGIDRWSDKFLVKKLNISEVLASYFSRFIIGAEFFLGIMLIFDNFLKKITIPLCVLMLSLFCFYLFPQIGLSSNCGCGGDIITFTPLETIVKNILTIIILLFVYTESRDVRYRFSHLAILSLFIASIMLAVFPISAKSNSDSVVSFLSFANYEDEYNDKLLCFFDAECDHCQKAARSLDSLSNQFNDFPEIFIVFPDMTNGNASIEEIDTMVNTFFKIVGFESRYKVIIDNGWDTDSIDSYHEIMYKNDCENPMVSLYYGIKQIRLFDGTGRNKFDPKELQQLLSNKN